MANRRPVQPEDLFRLAVIADAAISPDGAWVAYVVQRADLAANVYTSAIWVATTDGASAPRQITSGEKQDTAPRWSPDGSRLAFISDQPGKPQLFVRVWPDGEARAITSLGRGVADPVWSPDGRRIAFVSTEGEGLDDATLNQPGGPIRVIDRTTYRFDARGYVDGRFRHIWVIDADGGEPYRVTWGDHDDLAPAWSPDGGRIAFVSCRTGDWDTQMASQAYWVYADANTASGKQANGAPDRAQLVSLGAATANAPAWSPDGRWLAFIGRHAGAHGGENATIWLASTGGDRPAINLSRSFDRPIGVAPLSDTWRPTGRPTLYWSIDGQQVLATAADEGRTGLFRFPITGLETAEPTMSDVARVIGGDRTIALVSTSRDQSTIAFIASDFLNPCDAYLADGAGANERRLTELNQAVVNELALQEPAAVRIPSHADELTVHGWLVRPVGYDPAKQYPLILFIHGGPYALFGNVFAFDVQSWVSQGWHVLFINPRGSVGYGERFATIMEGWSDGDDREQLLALDAAIAGGGVDTARIGVTGVSYGGYMTNWLIGQSDRFRVAVSENGISNLISQRGTSDAAWYWFQRGARPEFFSNLNYWLDKSPIKYTPNVTTPTLFLQAESDYRCPIEQGEQFYTALRARNVPARLVRFPGESHGYVATGKPQTRLTRRRHLLDWFKQWLA